MAVGLFFTPIDQTSLPVPCLSDQASMLLQLSRSFLPTNESATAFRSWRAGTDCCDWEGVGCGDADGYVTSLHLVDWGLESAALDPVIFGLTSLRYLNLALNDFNGSQLPAFGFERLIELTHLNLSSSNFQGRIPVGIGRLTKLVSLDLSASFYVEDQVGHNDHDILLQLFSNLDWQFVEPNIGSLITNLSNLKQLYLDRVDLSGNGLKWCGAFLNTSTPELQMRFWKERMAPAPRALNPVHPPGGTGGDSTASAAATTATYPKLASAFPPLLPTPTHLQPSFTPIGATVPLPKTSNNGHRSRKREGRWIWRKRTPAPMKDRTKRRANQVKLPADHRSPRPPAFRRNPVRPRTPPPAPAPSLILRAADGVASARHQPRSSLPAISDFIAEEEHEVSVRRKMMRRKRAADSAKKTRRSRRLAAMEEPYYETVADKASRVKAAKLDMAKASERMKAALHSSGILERPPPRRISARKLRCLGRICGLPHLSEVEDGVGSSVLHKLQVLIIKSNKFVGKLGHEDGDICEFANLQIFDLASNNFSGILPNEWFKSMKAMMAKSGEDTSWMEQPDEPTYQFTATMTYKGNEEVTFSTVLKTLAVIDVSDNSFHGPIPQSLGDLVLLRGINLSHNALTGPIPSQLCALNQLEALDLSSNNLSGEIPQELASLDFLSTLNLSYNELEGRIPESPHFLTFANLSFLGNTGLCGLQVSKECNNITANVQLQHYKKKPIDIVLFLFVGLGFGAGFSVAIVLTWEFVLGEDLNAVRAHFYLLEKCFVLCLDGLTRKCLYIRTAGSLSIINNNVVQNVWAL
ncbi:unnamed protein product [Urochloa decumbens]|uniref:Leucine-rich repeat-containing N-terminal plant-type domain-containing protein n=1 Tax=Urochloa decumbens TaxID=240449 RepID=A0ABC8Z0Q4_9POAL